MRHKQNYNETGLDKLMRTLLSNNYDQFQDKPRQQISTQINNNLPILFLQEKTKYKKYRKDKNKRKHIKKQKKQIIIEIDSDNDKDNDKDYKEEVKQNILLRKGNNTKRKQQNNVIHILDQEQIQYLKNKLLDKNQQDQFSQKQQIGMSFSEQKKFIPPQDVAKVPKYIYQYPPYPLGPTDTWPPKYPNSWKSFKMDMRDTRRLN